MKVTIIRLHETRIYDKLLHIGLLFFRVMASLELFIVHGFKILGISAENVEKIPNPFGITELLNSIIAISASTIFPLMVILGLYTRLATLPIVAVTLSGYFVLQLHDNLQIWHIPFMYSVNFLFILFIGPGKYSLDYLFCQKDWE